MDFKQEITPDKRARVKPYQSAEHLAAHWQRSGKCYLISSSSKRSNTKTTNTADNRNFNVADDGILAVDGATINFLDGGAIGAAFALAEQSLTFTDRAIDHVKGAGAGALSVIMDNNTASLAAIDKATRGDGTLVVQRLILGASVVAGLWLVFGRK